MILGSCSNCVYCGEQPDTLDHLIPYSFAGRSPKRRGGSDTGLRMYSCRECSTTLGSKLFYGMWERTLYIHNQYNKKYRSVLNTYAQWSDEAISELSYNLAESLRHGMRAGKIADERTAWPYTAAYRAIIDDAIDHLQYIDGDYADWIGFLEN